MLARPPEGGSPSRGSPSARQGNIARRVSRCTSPGRLARRRDDDTPSRLHGLSKPSDVLLMVCRAGQEVEDGTIVPNVHGRYWPITGHVRFDPLDAIRLGSQPCLRAVECRTRDVEHADASDALAEDEIHEAGISAPMSMIQVAGPTPADSSSRAETVGVS